MDLHSSSLGNARASRSASLTADNPPRRERPIEMARALQQPLRTTKGSMQPPQVVKCGQLVLVQAIVRIFVPIRLRVGGVRMRWNEFVFDVLDCGFDMLDDLIHDL